MTHNQPDLIIRNGTLIDGANTPRRLADLAISNGCVVAIGTLSGTGREEIDARGKIVAPGFIDAHTHDDLAVLFEPDMPFKLSQGVTTCVCGNCGVSAAPLPDGTLPEPLNLVGLEGLPRFRHARDYLAALRDTPSAVNTVPLLGHSALRASVMGTGSGVGAGTARAANANEITAMRALAQEALQAGFFGISTGTFYAAAAHATFDELLAVCTPLKTHGGVLTSHLRDEGDAIIDALNETTALGKALGVRSILSHHKVAGMQNHGRSVETLAHITALQATQTIGLDCYPYSASSTVLRADRVRIAERTVITASGAQPDTVGREVGELARERGVSIEALCDALQPAGATYFNMSEADVERILAFPHTMIGSDGLPLQGKPHPRLWGTFPRVLGEYCRTRKLFSLETAIYKMTGLVAQNFGLARRGLLQPGYAADVTIFDAQTVRDQATFDAPTTPSVGIGYVIVNGVVAWRDGQPIARPGQLLKRGLAH